MRRSMRKHLFVVVWAAMFFLLTIAAPGHSAGRDDDSGWTKVTYDLIANDVQVNGCYGDDYVVLTGQLHRGGLDQGAIGRGDVGQGRLLCGYVWGGAAFRGKLYLHGQLA
jgi:hypothetical protein